MGPPTTLSAILDPRQPLSVFIIDLQQLLYIYMLYFTTLYIIYVALINPLSPTPYLIYKTLQ